MTEILGQDVGGWLTVNLVAVNHWRHVKRLVVVMGALVANLLACSFAFLLVSAILNIASSKPAATLNAALRNDDE